MIKLIQLPHNIRMLKSLYLLFTDKNSSPQSFGINLNLVTKENENLFLAQEESEEKIPLYVKLRVHPLKEVKTNGR